MSVVGRRAVAFGTTLNRELLPMKVPPNRFGNELGLRGAPNRGPGCYDNAEVVKKRCLFHGFLYFFLQQPVNFSVNKLYVRFTLSS